MNLTTCLLDSFSFGFIGRMNIDIDIQCSEMGRDKFETTFEQYQYIQKGLNYRVLCEKTMCPKKNEIIIVNRGFGVHRPHEEVYFIHCPNCQKGIEEFESIKNIILFRCKGRIEYRLAERGSVPQNKPFDVENNNQILFFGDEKMVEKYIFLKIIIDDNDRSDDIAGISHESVRVLQNRDDLPNIYIDCLEGFIKKD